MVHCRDCGIFSEALPRLLDRPLPETYRKEWAAHYARSKQLGRGTNSSAVILRIGQEWFGLPTHSVQEVSEPRPVHSIPHRPPGVLLGLTNIGGELMTCVSLGHLLRTNGLAAPERLRQGVGRMVVICLGQERYAFPAEEVQGVFRFHALDLRQPPVSGNRGAYGCTQGVLDFQGRNVGMLNAEYLFSALASHLS